MALDADWNVIKGLYAKGYNFSQISKQTGISDNAIRKHAVRYGWKATQLTVNASEPSMESVAIRAQSWVSRMMALCELQMAQLEAKCSGKVGIKALETLVRVSNTLDQIARRTFGLDAEKGGHTTNVLVTVNGPPAAMPTPRGEVIDVSCEKPDAMGRPPTTCG